MSMNRRGHEVSIIDRDATSFIRLDQQFGGAKVVGVGFDRDVLVRAGIETADAFAAVSSGDNSNIIAARVARIDVDESWIGTTVGRFQEQTGARIAFVSRVGRMILPDVKTVIQQDDQVYTAVLLDNLATARALAAGPAPARD